MNDIYKIEILTRANTKIDLSAYQNKVILIVNTASKCGFASQLDGLEKLYEKYKEKGFVIIAFPSNQFRQELTSSKKTVEFCKLNYGVTFPIMQTVNVNGKNQAPIYEYLTKNKRSKFGGKKIRWNFNKFLIDQNGQIVKRYSSSKDAGKIEKDLLKLL